MKFLVLPCRECNLNKLVTEELREKEGNGNQDQKKVWAMLTCPVCLTPVPCGFVHQSIQNVIEGDNEKFNLLIVYINHRKIYTYGTSETSFFLWNNPHLSSQTSFLLQEGEFQKATETAHKTSLTWNEPCNLIHIIYIYSWWDCLMAVTSGCINL